MVASVLLCGCRSDQQVADRSEASLGRKEDLSERVAEEWNPWRVSATPTVVIGDSSGVEEELAQVSAALRYSQGFVVVTSLPVSIRLYDEEGHFHGWLGREGEGPGEYRSIRGTWVAGGDTIIAYDPTLRRINYYGAKGDLIRTVPFDPGGSNVAGEERPREIVGRFSDGSFLTRQRIYPPLPGTPAPKTSNSFARLLREVPEIGLRDTITTVDDWDLAFRVEPGNRFGVWTAVPFSHSTSAVAWDTILIVADNRQFEVQFWSFEPRLIARFARGYAPLPITDRIWAGELDRRLNRFLKRIEANDNRYNLNVQGELAAIRREFREETRLESLPAHGPRMLVDEDGNVWIESWSDDQTIPSSGWHVLLAESRGFVGPIEVPLRFRPTAIYRDAIVGVEMDELDVESVRVFPILK